MKIILNTLRVEFKEDFDGFVIIKNGKTYFLDNEKIDKLLTIDKQLRNIEEDINAVYIMSSISLLAVIVMGLHLIGVF